ncbi:uncharacterized protein ACIBXB_003802 [Morphnus guianensis]
MTSLRGGRDEGGAPPPQCACVRAGCRSGRQGAVGDLRAAHACALRAPSMAAALRYPRALTDGTDRGEASRAASETLRGADGAGGGGEAALPVREHRRAAERYRLPQNAVGFPPPKAWMATDGFLRGEGADRKGRLGERLPVPEFGPEAWFELPGLDRLTPRDFLCADGSISS